MIAAGFPRPPPPLLNPGWAPRRGSEQSARAPDERSVASHLRRVSDRFTRSREDPDRGVPMEPRRIAVTHR
jgi:hypothetical protein